MAVEIYMPKMSDHMEAGEVIRWLAHEGEPVEEGQPLLEITTDKVVATCDAPGAGVLKGVREGVRQGARVAVGETIAFIAAPDEAVPVLPPLGPPAAAGAPQPTAAPTARASRGPVTAEPGVIRAAPAARALARELGVDLAHVTGTGPEGRIKVEDVRAFHEGSQARPPAAPPAPAAEDVDWLELTPIRRLTGERMLASTQTMPQFALTVSADVTAILALREALLERIQAQGVHLSLTAVLVRAVAGALRRHPRANASFVDGRVACHRQVNVGVALGTESGLVVPVIHDADVKTLVQIAVALESFRNKAVAMRFESADLAGGTFTISNLGMYGVDRFTAIVNPPECAILAVGRIVKTPVGLPDDTVGLRPLVSLTLTVDHRVLDGLQAARFLAEVRDRLEQPYLWL